MGVSENRDTPKWMVYNGKPYKNGMIWGEIHYFRKLPYPHLSPLKAPCGLEPEVPPEDFCQKNRFSKHRKTLRLLSTFFW